MYSARRNATSNGGCGGTGSSNSNGATRGGGNTSASSKQGGGAANGGGNRTSQATTTTNFHPKLIFTQIVCLQFLHYFLLTICFQINGFLYGTSITIDRIFTDHYIRLFKISRYGDVCAILLTSMVGSIFLALIVEKSKKCLDFAVTLFLLHLFLTILYDGFPHVFDWWFVHILGTILMVVFGEYLCSRREMEDIPLLAL